MTTSTHTRHRIPADSPRLRARQAELLRRLGPLSGPVDAELDAVLRLAEAVTGAAAARINLLDDAEQISWTRVDPEPVRVPRGDSICARTSQLPGVYACPDLPAEPDWAGHPFTDGRRGRIRLFASAPLRLPSGDVLGTLCVHDDVPRALTADQLARLADLATIATGLLERRRHVVRAVQSAAAAQEAQTAAEEAGARADRARAFESALFEALPVGVITADATGRPVRVNRVVAEWTGCRDTAGAVDAQALDRRLYAADGRTPLGSEDTPLARAFRGEPVRDVEVVSGEPGRFRRVGLTNGAAIRGDDGTLLGAVVTITDVTRQRELEQQLRDAALRDPLTGLANRSLLVDRLLQALRSRAGVPFAVVYCDVDGLKRINDTSGHGAGDVALKEVAAHLRSVVRQGDTVARVGGDEFVVVCPEIATREDADRLTARLARALEPGACSGVPPLKVSTGVALSRDGDTPESLLCRADEAMYTGRRARRSAAGQRRDPAGQRPADVVG